MKKSKKILSLLLSVAMICTVFTAFGVSVNATETNEIVVTDINDLQGIITSATKDTKIKIGTDIRASEFAGYIAASGKTITINLNNHTVECGFLADGNIASILTIYGGGTIIGAHGNSAGYIDGNTTFTARDVKFIGSDAQQDNCKGGFGINIGNGVTATLTNCYVAAGKTKGKTDNNSAVTVFNNSIIKAKDCTFVRGSGGVENIVSPIVNDGSSGKLCDLGGNEITGMNSPNSPLVIGKGYGFDVTGSTIKDTDGTPARGTTTIGATADIPAPTYTVTIPVAIDFGNPKQALEKYKNDTQDQYGNPINVSKPFTIIATNVNNLYDDLGKKPQIDVAVTFDGLLKDSGTSTIPYTVKMSDNSSFTSGNVFCSFQNSSEVAGEQKASATVCMNRTDIKKTANYTGTMTFTISIPDQK